MASDRGYAVPEGFNFIPGDAGEIIGQLPVDSLPRVQVAAGYGVLVPSDLKLPKGLSAASAAENDTVDALASLVPEPVIEVPDGEPAETVPGGVVPEDAPAEKPATDSTADSTDAPASPAA